MGKGNAQLATSDESVTATTNSFASTSSETGEEIGWAKAGFRADIATSTGGEFSIKSAEGARPKEPDFSFFEDGEQGLEDFSMVIERSTSSTTLEKVALWGWI